MTSKALAIAAVSLTVLATACASRPEGVLAPVLLVAPVPGAGDVDMLVATTRKSVADPAFLYSGERGDRLTLVDMDISIPPGTVRKAGTVQWPRRLPPDPRTEFATVRATPIELRDSRAWMKRHLGKRRSVLVFVHGFNNRFEDSVYRFAQIVHDSGADVTPVLFTWPSGASILDYGYDKESTNYSRDGLEAVLKALADDPNVAEVSVMAHSMGTWLATESLRQMAIRDGRIAPKIRNVILASPDLDVDVFRKQWQAYGKAKPKFTIFVSGDDRALAVSRLISGDQGRLGAVDPSSEPYKSEFERAGIDVIDLTTYQGNDFLNHSKFAESPEVVRLIGQRLMDGQPISDSKVGIGEAVGAVVAGAAQVVGQGAAAVVRAPLSIGDASSRRTLARRIDASAKGAGNTLPSPYPRLRRRCDADEHERRAAAGDDWNTPFRRDRGEMGMNASQRGLLKLMLRMPAIRGELQILHARDQTIESLCEAYGEASDVLERLSRDHTPDHGMVAEYERLCRDIETDVIDGCLSNGRLST